MTYLIKPLMRAALCAAVLACGGPAVAHTVLTVDASAAVTPPEEGHIEQGSAVSPAGVVIGINSRYLTRNGQPWFPVMGEFHYTRSPASQWERELRAMKAAGITVVASYVIWNHHEEQQGRFDWSERRDLRRFVELCRKVGLDMVLRVGPWAHAEVRFGGFPDWVVDTMPTRENDGQYLQFVERYYRQIGAQVQGLLWKDGGPVIGVQLENEYNLRGPGKGAEHIAALKALALKAGLDTPLYTVTGWDGAIYPPGAVTPVFGGYVDEPWSASKTELPPKETYVFRFDTRVSGDLGAQTAARGPGTADQEIGRTPFFGAEYGPGVPFMYRRRPLIASDDVAAMLPVQLGSGVNLLGYYMFHGGRNPAAQQWLHESTGSGGFNDVPLINYDFQAPLGPDGQQREVLAKLRPYHWFLQDFGARLATMTVRKPAQIPSGRSDLATPRFSVRSNGDSGFVFVNNHVRQYPMAAHGPLRFALKLPAASFEFPSKPVTIADGDYFIWPFNFDMDGVRLRHATAQPLARIDQGAAGVTYVFAAHRRHAVELAFDASLAPMLVPERGKLVKRGDQVLLQDLEPGTSLALTIRPQAKSQQREVRMLVLSAEQAEQVTIATLAGQRRLLWSAQQVVQDDDGLTLRSTGSPDFRLGVFPPLASAHGLKQSVDGVFQVLSAQLPAREIAPVVTPLRPAQAAPPVRIGGNARAALAPIPEAFKAAASWQIALPPNALEGLDDALLNIDFVGDIGRLYAGTDMLDDWYYSGYGWQYGLRQLAGSGRGDQPLTLSVLPLRADAPIYLDQRARPDFAGAEQLAQLRKVSVTPVYQLKLRLPAEHK
ncbi:MAG: beta-galactosidase [Duganella sp.]